MFQHIKTHLSRRQFRLLMLLLVVASEYSFLVVPGTFAAGVEQILASSSISTASNTDGWIVMSTAPQTPRTPRTPRTVTPSVTPTPVVQSQKQASNTDGWLTSNRDTSLVRDKATQGKNTTPANTNPSYNSAPSISTIPSFPTGTQTTIASSGPYISAPISQVQYSLGAIPGNSNGNQVVNGTQTVNGDNTTNGSTTTTGNATVGGNQTINGTTTTRDLVIKNGTGTPTELLGRDSSGSVNRVTLGTGLTLSGGVLVADAGGTITNSSDIATLSGNISTLSGVVSTKITLTDLSATGGISYNSGSGLFSWIGTTDVITEGLTNLYYTTARFVADFTARFQSAFDAAFGGKTTDNLAEGTGSLYFTDSRAQNAMSGTVATITGNMATTDSNLTTLSGNLANTNTDVTTLSGRVMVAETNITTLSGKLTQSALVDTLSGASMMLSGIISESANITGTGIISRLVATIANIPTLISSTISAVTANITNLIASVINADTATIGTLTTGNVTSTGTATFNLANFLGNVVFDTLPSLPLSRGSLLVGSNTNKASELSSGGTGQVLIILNGTPVWTDAATVAPVVSLFGRTGSVIAQTGDYTTSQVTESGSLYFTNTRARASISATGVVTYDSVNGVIGWNGTTDNVPEGGTNHYYTESRFSGSLAAQKNISNGVAGLDANAKVSIMNLPGITMNSVWTATSQADCTTKTSATRGDICIATIDSKSYILSTTHYETQSDWQELLNPAAPVSQVNGQVGNINFVGANGVTLSGTTISLSNVGTGGLYGSATRIPVITTDAQGRVTNVTETTIPTATAGQLGLLSPSDYVRFDAKQDLIGTGTTAQYYRGDKTWATLDTSVVPENGNLYFTVSRVRNALSATGALTYNSSTGEFGDAFSFGNGLTRSGNTVGISSITGTQLSGFTTGQLTFGTASGGLTQSSGLFWDSTNNRLGIGTNTPTNTVSISSDTSTPFNITTNSSGTAYSSFYAPNANYTLFQIGESTTRNSVLTWDKQLSRAVFQTASNNFPFAFYGSAVSFNPQAGGITFTPSSGQNTTFTSGNVGIGTSSPAQKLEVAGNAKADRFIAYGSGGITTNSAFGFNTLLSNTTGFQNTAVGYQSLQNNTTGNYNTANGFNSLSSNTTGSNNNAIGYQTLSSNTTGINNNAVGNSALHFNTIGSYNTAQGNASMYKNTTGSNNSAFGNSSLFNNTTGTGNTAIGDGVLFASTIGSNNTALGMHSLVANTTGYNNTANGWRSLYTNTTGFNNTALGYNAGNTITTGSNNIVIGYNAQVVSPTASNQLSIGNWIYGSGGNIGIGTTAPNYNLSFGTNLANTKLALWDNGAGSSYGLGVKSNEFRFNVAGASADFRFYDAEAGNALFTIKGNGNIGIGTPTPNTKLEINSGTGGLSGLRFTQLTSANTGSTSNSFLTLDASGNVVVGQVGIGFINANGTYSSNTEVRDYNTWANRGNGFYITDNGAAISNGIPNQSAWFTLSQVAKNAGYFGQTSLNDQGFWFRGGSTSSISTNTWRRTLSLDANSRFDVQYGGTGTNLITLNNVDSGALAFSTNNSERVRIDATGQVGIGTSTPNSKLEIDNTTANTSGLRFTRLTSTGTASSLFSGILGVNSTGDVGLAGFNPGQLLFGSTASGLTQSSSLFWDNTNGRLGIGTNNPAYKLNIVDGNASLRFGAAIGSTTDAFLQLRSQTTSNWTRIGTNGSPLAILTQGTDETSTGVALFVHNNGNVGIGTTSPSMKLVVQDSAYTAPGMHNKVFGAYSTALSVGASSQLAWGASNSTNNQAEFNFYYAGNGSSSNYVGIGLFGTPSTLAVLANGNVGIGTTSPNSKFEINSGLANTAGLRFTQMSGSGTPLLAGTASGNVTRAVGISSSGDMYITNGLGSLDSRSVDYTPSDRPAGFYIDFKNNSTNGLNDGGLYNGVMTFRSYGFGTDLSGGKPMQISYTENGNLYTRLGTGATNWDTWRRLLVENSSGNVGIGTTTPTTLLHLQGSKASSTNGTDIGNYLAYINNTNITGNAGGMMINIGAATPGGNNQWIELTANGVEKGSIEGNGGNVNFYTASDMRLKNNLGISTYGLKDLLKIQVHDYSWKESGVIDNGFFAQELYEIYPFAVSPGDANNIWKVDYAHLAPLLVQSLQELAQNTASTGALNTLSGQVALLSQSSGATTVVNNNYYSSGTTSSGSSSSWVDTAFSFVSSLIVRVEATFSEMVTFMKSVVFRSTVTFEDRVTFSDKDMAGTATIRAGERSVRVDFSRPYSEIPRVTVTADAFVTYRVTDKMVTGFTIETQSPVSTDTNFDWMALMVRGLVTTTPSAPSTPSSGTDTSSTPSNTGSTGTGTGTADSNTGSTLSNETPTDPTPTESGSVTPPQTDATPTEIAAPTGSENTPPQVDTTTVSDEVTP